MNERDDTLPAVLDAQCEVRPDQPVLHIAGTSLTYRELRDRSVAAANVLSELGIGSGDRMALFMGTAPEWVVLWFALSRLGAVAVPVNTAFRGDFLAHQLRDSETVAMAVDQSLLGRVTAIAGEVPGLRRILVRPEEGASPGTAVEGGLAVGDIGVLAEGDATSVRVPGAAGDRPGAVFYTSGTTGPSKGVLATPHYLLTAARTILGCWGLQAGEAVYAPLPLFHLSAIGSVLGPMLAGGTGVVDRAFSVHATWDEVRRHEAVGIALAGAQVTMLWNLPPDERDRELPLRFLSAAPVPKELYHDIERRYECRIVTCYGLSEAFPLTVAGVTDDTPPGASGRPNPDFEVKIFDGDDHEVAAGTVGEIVCRPRRPHVMFEGYAGRPAETLQQLSSLWFHTGDLGRIDEEGWFWYADRKKDAMRRRGENISSFEVEQAILRHPDVAEVAAIGVPSELGEDDVMVFLVAKEGCDLDVVAFMDFCCDRLPYFAVPRYVERCAGLPKNAVGRVLKHELRASGVTEATWDREAAGYVVRR